MNENLDLVKVLKDCPSGTKLYSKCLGTVEFNKVIQNRYIEIVDNSGCFILYRCNGKLKQSSQDAEIDLFPSKDQYDWSKWQRPFVEGDVVMFGDDQFAIFKEYIKHSKCHTLIKYHAYYDAENDNLDTNDGQSYIRIQRLATEDEKQKLFDAIKSHGYKWNTETKNLENLIKSKEDTEDKTVMSGIYFDREYYADEVELHLNNYEIEIRDGKTYAIFKNQETKISKPKFKVGDKIKHKDDKTVITITGIKNDYYFIQFYNINRNDYQNEKISFKYQDQYELVSNKFDISTLKPFDKVLVRDDNTLIWTIEFFGFYDTVITKKYPFVASSGNWAQCIPYEGNEHLLGKYDDCDEYYKNW